MGFALHRSLLPALSFRCSKKIIRSTLYITMSSGGQIGDKNNGRDVSSATSSSRSSLHDEKLVRPETAGVSHCKKEQAELVFFNTFFCPYAQMAWIAINEKGAASKTEFVEGLTIRGGDYQVHPRLEALGRSGVPTLFHQSTKTVVDGSTDCVAFVDEYFGEPHQLIPAGDEELSSKTRRCERMLHSIFTFPFYSMLLRQEPDEQEKAKQELVLAVKQLVRDYQGPFYSGERFTAADIALAPYFDRMVVLEHYRNFTVPPDIVKWHDWSANVLSRPSVASTRQERERIIEAYKRYAKCYVRNNWYERVFVLGR